MVQLQDSISERLHHHTFSSMLFGEHLKPIVPKFYHILAQGQALGLWFDQSFQSFDYLPQFFTQHFVRNLDYPIP
jgi:hypothetical protein